MEDVISILIVDHSNFFLLRLYWPRVKQMQITYFESLQKIYEMGPKTRVLGIRWWRPTRGNKYLGEIITPDSDINKQYIIKNEKSKISYKAAE